jgi:hypothetical protein
MAKFTFPVRQDSLVKMFGTTEGKQVLKELQSSDDVTFAMSCFRTGWLNKQHHKAKQLEDAEYREMLKNDPKLKEEVRRRIAEAAKRSA